MKKKTLINYWETYYGKNSKFKESSFARFVFNKIKGKKKYKNLIDIGCGNGRDSIFFNKKNLDVLGIDISTSAIKKIRYIQIINLDLKILMLKKI